MKTKAIKSILAATLCVCSLAMVGCGNSGSTAISSSSSTESKADATEKKEANEFTTKVALLYNEDEELEGFTPMNPVGSSRAEAMMQVSGYDYTLIPGSDNKYEFVVVMTCGAEGSDMYMKRTYKYIGTYAVDGSVYTLEAPTNVKFEQATGGQFAAESGEGGADYWGPNGLSYDETFTNEEAYGGAKTGAQLLEAMQACKVTVDGDKITTFEALN